MTDKLPSPKKSSVPHDTLGVQNLPQPSPNPFLVDTPKSVMHYQAVLGNRKTIDFIQRTRFNASVTQRINSALIQRDTDVSGNFGITVPVNVKDDVAGVFTGNVATITPLLSGTDVNKRTQIIQLMKYLRSDAANAQTLLDHLVEMNTYFGTTERELKQAGGSYASLANLNTAVPLIRAITDGRKAKVVEVFTRRGYPEIIKIFTNPDAAAAIAAIDPLAIGNQTTQHLTKETLEVIRAVRTAHPPGSGFAGGMAWGKGELPDVDTNKEAHFLKHCLRQYQADANPDVNEPWKWMGITGHSITVAYIEGFTGALDPLVKTQIAGDTDRISSEGQANYFFNTYLPNLKATNEGVYNNLIDDLKTTYQPAYVNAVQAVTNALENPFVTVNSGKVQIVGTNGQQFIVGKWNGAAFAISSSYLNVGKVAENTPYKLWNL